MVKPRESETIESSTVKESPIVTTHATNNMKSCLVLLALVATLLLFSSESSARELCPQENCLTPDKCSSPISDSSCPEQSDMCCSVVKSEYRTHCRHHGGACMSSCAPILQQDVVDCPDDTVCCVLV